MINPLLEEYKISRKRIIFGLWSGTLYVITEKSLKIIKANLGDHYILKTSWLQLNNANFDLKKYILFYKIIKF